MRDLISRQAAIDAVEAAIGFDTRYYWAIKDLPSVHPMRKKGKWRRISADKYVQHATAFYRCLECGLDSIGETNFCPNCGADMRGDADEPT